MQQAPSGGPHILGFDVIWIATMLSAVATLAVMLAIYAATTVKDPMARRVKALNERREQLKAGIVASTNKRKKLTNRNEAADRVRSILTQFKMLQDDQLKKTQTRLMQAGIRSKDLAFFVIGARFVLPARAARARSVDRACRRSAAEPPSAPPSRSCSAAMVRSA